MAVQAGVVGFPNFWIAASHTVVALTHDEMHSEELRLAMQARIKRTILYGKGSLATLQVSLNLHQRAMALPVVRKMLPPAPPPKKQETVDFCNDALVEDTLEETDADSEENHSDGDESSAEDPPRNKKQEGKGGRGREDS